MTLILDPQEAAIRRAIKTVGVGKKGSKALDASLAKEVLDDLVHGRVSAAAQGAFWAGLLAKGIEPQEEILAQAFDDGVFKDTQKLIDHITNDAPDFVRWVCQQLFNGQTLDIATAHDLGRFLFSNEPGDGARGLIASFLRVRYETDDEYEGIWRAMQETIEESFRLPLPSGDPVIQLSEPFDGNDHSYLITPLVAKYLHAEGYRVIHMVGRNSGPKLVFNLLDVAGYLSIDYVKQNSDLAQQKPLYGWFFRQQDISKSLDRWVDIRHQTIKRPFLATLEKFIKPVESRIMVSSAFHPPYGEKMTTISERAGFAGIMVIRNGIEGSMAFPLKRPAKILLSARQDNGTYLRHEITFDVESFLGVTPNVEERREQLTAKENARLIKAYTANGTSGDEWFDLRVKATCAGFGQGLEWLKKNIQGG